MANLPCWPNPRGGDPVKSTVLKACVVCFPNPAPGTAARDADGGVGGSGADCRLDSELGEADLEPGGEADAEGVRALRDARASTTALGGGASTAPRPEPKAADCREGVLVTWTDGAADAEDCRAEGRGASMARVNTRAERLRDKANLRAVAAGPCLLHSARPCSRIDT